MRRHVLWITGARGFIGRHVARAAAATGATAIGIGHGAWAPDGMRQWGVADWLNADITHANLEILRAKHGAPDALVHLAGGSSVAASLAQPREDFERTVGTTSRLLDWIRLQSPATRVVLASSAAVYGSAHAGAIPEDAPHAPVSPYGHHKAAMEHLARSYGESYGMQVAIVRLFSVYGPGLEKQLLWDALLRLQRGEDPLLLGGTGEEQRDWVHVDAAARCLIAAVAMADTTAPALNGGTGVATTVRATAETLVRAWGSGTVRFSGTSRPGDPRSLVARPGRLPILDAPGLAEGLDQVVRWFRARTAPMAGS